VVYCVCLSDATTNGQEGDARIEQSYLTASSGVKVH